MSDDHGYAIRIWNTAIENQLYDTGRYYSRIPLTLALSIMAKLTTDGSASGSKTNEGTPT